MSKGRYYLKTHEWVEFIDDTTVRVGISDYAQAELGDIVFINLPEVGDDVNVEESFAEVESVKSISDIFSPVSGVISDVNVELEDKPELINEDAYEAWFIEVSEITSQDDLLTEKEYEEFLVEDN